MSDANSSERRDDVGVPAGLVSGYDARARRDGWRPSWQARRGSGRAKDQRKLMVKLDDDILLEGLECYGYHGVHPEERRLGQRFSVDITIATDVRAASASDDVSQTISYSAVAKLARAIIEGPPRNLIETVASEIASAVLAELTRAERVTVTLRKPNAPMKGMIFAAAGVTVRRSREHDS